MHGSDLEHVAVIIHPLIKLVPRINLLLCNDYVGVGGSVFKYEPFRRLKDVRSDT